jgi:WD40 repeat protein
MAKKLRFLISVLHLAGTVSLCGKSISFALAHDERMDLDEQTTSLLAKVSRTISDIVSQEGVESTPGAHLIIPINSNKETVTLILNNLNNLNNTIKIEQFFKEYTSMFDNEKRFQVIQDIYELARYLDIPLLEKIAFSQLSLYRPRRSYAPTDKIEFVLADNQTTFLAKKEIPFLQNLFKTSAVLKGILETLGHTTVTPKLFDYSTQGTSLNPLYLSGLSVESFYQLLSIKELIVPVLDPSMQRQLKQKILNKNVSALIKLALAADFLDLPTILSLTIDEIINKLTSPEVINGIKKGEIGEAESSLLGLLDPLLFFKMKKRLFPQAVIHEQIEITPYGETLAICFNEANELIIANRDAQKIVIHNMTTLDKSIFTFEYPPHAAAFDKNAETIAVGLVNGSVYVINLKSSTLSKDLNPSLSTSFSTNNMRSVVISNDGHLVVVGLNDGTARIWQLPELSPQAILKGDRYDAFNTLALSNDNRYLASKGASLKRISFWDISTGKFTGNFLQRDITPTSFTFHSNYKQLIVAAQEQFVIAYDLDQSRIIEDFTIDIQPQTILMTSDGQWLVITGKNKVIFLNTTNEDDSVTLKLPAIKKVCFSAQNALVALLDKKNMVSLIYLNAFPQDKLDKKTLFLLNAAHKTEHLLIIYAFAQELRKNADFSSPILNQLDTELHNSSKENIPPQKSSSDESPQRMTTKRMPQKRN